MSKYFNLKIHHLKAKEVGLSMHMAKTSKIYSQINTWPLLS